jgi:hypothetical protein
LDTVGPALSQVRRAKAERKLSMRAEIRLTEVRGSAAQVAPCADGQRAAVGSSGSSCDPIPAATRASRARSDIWATPCVSDVAKDLAALDGRAQNGEHLPALGDRGRGDAPRGGREAPNAPRGPYAHGPSHPPEHGHPPEARQFEYRPSRPGAARVWRGRRALGRCRQARKQWWAGTGLNGRHEDFQACRHRLPWTPDPLLYVMIRAVRGFGSTRGFRIGAYGHERFGPSRVRVNQAGLCCQAPGQATEIVGRPGE